MAIDNVNRAGDPSSNPRTDRVPDARSDDAAPVLRSRRREIVADATNARPADAVEVDRYEDVVNRYRANQEQLQRTLEGRRKLVDAVRELMEAGAMETPQSARRAADGILRRGAVA